MMMSLLPFRSSQILLELILMLVFLIVRSDELFCVLVLVVPFNSSPKLENCEVRCSGTSKEYASVRENCSNLGCMHLLKRIVQTFHSGPVECLSCIKQPIFELIVEDTTNGLVLNPSIIVVNSNEASDRNEAD